MTGPMESILNRLYPAWVIACKSAGRALFRKRCLIIAAVCGLPILAALAFRISIRPQPPGQHLALGGYQFYANLQATAFLQFLIPIVPLFLGTAAINDEIEEKTLIFLFLRPVSKFLIVLAKTVSVMISSTVILGVTGVLVFLICASTTGAAMLPGDLPLLMKDLWVYAMASFAYAGFFLFLGVMFRHPHIPALIFVFAWDEYAAYLPGSAGILNIKHYVTSIFPHEADQESFLHVLSYHEPVQPFLAVLVLLGIGFVFSFLAFAVFQSKDYGFEKASA